MNKLTTWKSIQLDDRNIQEIRNENPIRPLKKSRTFLSPQNAKAGLFSYFFRPEPPNKLEKSKTQRIMLAKLTSSDNIVPPTESITPNTNRTATGGSPYGRIQHSNSEIGTLTSTHAKSGSKLFILDENTETMPSRIATSPNERLYDAISPTNDEADFRQTTATGQRWHIKKKNPIRKFTEKLQKDMMPAYQYIDLDGQIFDNNEEGTNRSYENFQYDFHFRSSFAKYSKAAYEDIKFPEKEKTKNRNSTKLNNNLMRTLMKESLEIIPPKRLPDHAELMNTPSKRGSFLTSRRGSVSFEAQQQQQDSARLQSQFERVVEPRGTMFVTELWSKKLIEDYRYRTKNARKVPKKPATAARPDQSRQTNNGEKSLFSPATTVSKDFRPGIFSRKQERIMTDFLRMKEMKLQHQNDVTKSQLRAPMKKSFFGQNATTKLEKDNSILLLAASGANTLNSEFTNIIEELDKLKSDNEKDFVRLTTYKSAIDQKQKTEEKKMSERIKFKNTLNRLKIAYKSKRNPFAKDE